MRVSVNSTQSKCIKRRGGLFLQIRAVNNDDCGFRPETAAGDFVSQSVDLQGTVPA